MEERMTQDEQFKAEAAIRRALLNDIQRWEGLVREANDVLRSTHEICKRRGMQTNWEPFQARVAEALEHQHAALYPKPEPEAGS